MHAIGTTAGEHNSRKRTAKINTPMSRRNTGLGRITYRAHPSQPGRGLVRTVLAVHIRPRRYNRVVRRSRFLRPIAAAAVGSRLPTVRRTDLGSRNCCSRCHNRHRRSRYHHCSFRRSLRHRSQEVRRVAEHIEAGAAAAAGPWDESRKLPEVSRAC